MRMEKAERTRSSGVPAGPALLQERVRGGGRGSRALKRLQSSDTSKIIPAGIFWFLQKKKEEAAWAEGQEEREKEVP